jgi:precorrin-2 dehydrogenase/sirohydrochlorin ferrochelatase
MIPLFHDFSGATVLVFGGGRVGARKARRFAAEADVVVVSPEFSDDDFGGAELVRGAPESGDVGGWVGRVEPALVVVATDSGPVNDAAAAAAREAGALVNRADESGARADVRSVVVPATVSDGDVTAAVSTGGRSPALSRHLRAELEETFAGADAMAELSALFRSEMKERGVPPEDRRAAVRTLVSDPRVWKGLRAGSRKANQEAVSVLEGLRGDSTT